MTSTSSDRIVLRDMSSDVAEAAPPTDLRSGTWTRLGADGVLGDPVTEATLAALAETTREAARAQGYAAGWAQGRRAFLAEAATAEAQRLARQQADHARDLAERHSVTVALGAAVTACQAQVEQLAAELASHTVALAMQIAEAVLGREVATAADPGADALRRALTSVPPLVPVTVRLHPADRALLDPSVLEDRPVTFVDDPGLQRGDAVVETETGVVDATLGAALDRVREVLAR